MINPVDRTGDLIRALAGHHGVSADSHATLKPSSSVSSNNDGGGAAAIVDGNGDEDEVAFMRVAGQLAVRIDDMSKWVHSDVDGRYRDFSPRGLTDGQRDEVDGVLSMFVGQVVETIDRLKARAMTMTASDYLLQINIITASPSTPEVKPPPLQAAALRRRRWGGIGRRRDETESTTTSTTTRGMRRQGPCDVGSVRAFLLGVVVTVSERLRSVTEKGEVLRAARVRHALHERERTRVTYDAAVARQLVEEQRASAATTGDAAGGDAVENREKGDGHDGRCDEIMGSSGDDDDDANDNASLKDSATLLPTDAYTASTITSAAASSAATGADDAGLVQMFARENASLVSTLVETREQVRSAEQAVATIAQLNEAFTCRVVDQAREIDTLYTMAVDATRFVDGGNRELDKMRGKGARLKYAVAGLALLLAVILLVVEWVGRRRWL